MCQRCLPSALQGICEYKLICVAYAFRGRDSRRDKMLYLRTPELLRGRGSPAFDVTTFALNGGLQLACGMVVVQH